MAAALPFLAIASTAMSFFGALQQGQAAKQAADYNSQVNTQNAGIARQNAADQAKQVDRDNYMRLGQIRANAGHNGGGASGSALDVLGDVAAQGELEKQNTLYQGELKARGYQNTATLDTMQGDNAVTASYFKAGSSLLSGGTDYSTGGLKRA